MAPCAVLAVVPRTRPVTAPWVATKRGSSSSLGIGSYAPFFSGALGTTEIFPSFSMVA